MKQIYSMVGVVIVNPLGGSHLQNMRSAFQAFVFGAKKRYILENSKEAIVQARE